MSTSKNNGGKRQSSDDFQDLREVLQEMDKEALLHTLHECWQTKHTDVQSLIRGVVSKKQKSDKENRENKERDKKYISENSWVFPDTYTGCNQRLNMKNKIIKLGLYRDKTKDLELDDIEWDEENGAYIATIEENGCKGCSGAEIVTIKLERNKDGSKRRVKATSYAECYCTYDHGNYLLHKFYANAADYGYPEGAVEENKFD